MEQLVKVCDRCGNKIDSKYSWSLSLNYCGQGSFHKENLCGECINKEFGLDKNKIKFFEALVEFRRQNHISPNGNLERDKDWWTKKTIKEFLFFIKERKLQIDYKVPILYDWNSKSEIYLERLINRNTTKKEKAKINEIHKYSIASLIKQISENKKEKEVNSK